MKRHILLLSGLCLTLSCLGQAKSGGISEKMLGEMEKEQRLTTVDRALVNAIGVATYFLFTRTFFLCRNLNANVR